MIKSLPLILTGSRTLIPRSVYLVSRSKVHYDYYTMLGVDNNASPEDIQQAYSVLKRSSEALNNQQKMNKVNEAYRVLSDQ